MDNKEPRKVSRFPLALPADVRAAVEKYAEGSSRRPGTSLNEAIVFLIRKGLEALAKDEKGQPAAERLAA